MDCRSIDVTPRDWLLEQTSNLSLLFEFGNREQEGLAVEAFLEVARLAGEVGFEQAARRNGTNSSPLTNGVRGLNPVELPALSPLGGPVLSGGGDMVEGRV
jgi:hypothetical protein